MNVKMKKSIIVFTACVLNTPIFSYADWHQTHWGMNIQQVKKCLNDPYEVPDTPRDQYNYNIYSGDKTLLSEENFDVNGMSFNVRYIFDDNNKLKAINMVGDENYYDRTISLLSGKYGKPAYFEQGLLPNATWSVPDKHLLIKLSRVSHTIIRYEPISNAL